MLYFILTVHDISVYIHYIILEVAQSGLEMQVLNYRSCSWTTLPRLSCFASETLSLHHFGKKTHKKKNQRVHMWTLC